MLIKVAAAGVNRADILQAAGHYPPPPGASELLGMEVSGVVAAVATTSVTGRPGKKSALCWPAADTPNMSLFPLVSFCPIPGGVDLQDAAGLPEVACTVWSNLVLTAHLSQGQLVLIHGGASGVGTHAIQVARELGARVAITAGSSAKLELCRELGADITIAYRDEDFVARVHDATDGAGADVILDIMGAAYLDRNLDALASDGQLIVIGMQGGVKGELNLGKLIEQTGAGDRDRAAGPTGDRPQRQERHRRGGDDLGLADDCWRTRPAGHRGAHADPAGR